jgi:hypothetical protein
MAKTPYDMLTKKEKVNRQTVDRQPKDQKQYLIIWEDEQYVSEVNLEALATKYIALGWTVKIASDVKHSISSLTLIQPHIKTLKEQFGNYYWNGPLPSTLNSRSRSCNQNGFS